MTTVAPTHSAIIELAEPVPPDVPVGGDFVVKLKLTCPAGCDPHQAPLVVTGPEGQPPVTDAGCDEVRQIVLKAPASAGEHAWSVALASQDFAGVVHQGQPLTFGVTAKPHATSLAVWDIPAPVVIGSEFAIEVGAKSAGDYRLSGRAIEVRDGNGGILAEGRLGEAPWPGTTGLYWTEIRLAAPAEEGSCSWSVRFAATGLELPHDEANANFSFTAVRPPEHRLTLKVVAKETAAPIDEAHIRVGAFRATTDEAGTAAVELPKGTYDLTVWKAGFEVPDQTVQVDGDLDLQLEAVTLPEEDPDAIWTA